MAMSLQSLDVVVTLDSFYFVRPHGAGPTTLLDGRLEKLLQSRFALTSQLQKQVTADYKHMETASGWCAWLCFGCARASWDWDMDMARLSREVLDAVAAQSLLRPGVDFELKENIQEGSWREGRVLLSLVLLGPPVTDQRVDTAAPYCLANPLEGERT